MAARGEPARGPQALPGRGPSGSRQSRFHGREVLPREWTVERKALANEVDAPSISEKDDVCHTGELSDCVDHLGQPQESPRRSARSEEGLVQADPGGSGEMTMSCRRAASG